MPKRGKTFMHQMLDKYVNIRYASIDNKDMDVSKISDMHVPNSKNIRYVRIKFRKYEIFMY